jgi:hypothetical protein
MLIGEPDESWGRAHSRMHLLSEFRSLGTGLVGSLKFEAVHGELVCWNKQSENRMPA